VTPAVLIADAIGSLEAAGVPYMVTGSVASTFHGEPRSTNDLDIVIDPDTASLVRLVEALQTRGYYLDPDAAAEALRERTQFNAIAGDVKVDFIVRKARPFSLEELRRRQPADLLGTRGFIATVEDTIIAKLEWAAATDSERQLRDVSGMVAVAGNALDREYLDRWIAELGLGETWRRVEA
jgi:hypothetical protein